MTVLDHVATFTYAQGSLEDVLQGRLERKPLAGLKEERELSKQHAIFVPTIVGIYQDYVPIRVSDEDQDRYRAGLGVLTQKTNEFLARHGIARDPLAIDLIHVGYDAQEWGGRDVINPFIRDPLMRIGIAVIDAFPDFYEKDAGAITLLRECLMREVCKRTEINLESVKPGDFDTLDMQRDIESVIEESLAEYRAVGEQLKPYGLTRSEWSFLYANHSSLRKRIMCPSDEVRRRFGL